MKIVKPNAGWFAFAFVVLGIHVSHARADEPSGLQVAASIEQAIVKAIGDCEKSVVSIARVNPERQAVARDRRGLFPLGGSIDPDPTDPDFVPEEFATGVVIDAKGLILTNYHFANNANDHYYVTTIDRKVFMAEFKVAAGDARSDLAVLRVVDGSKDQSGTLPIKPTDFVPIKFGDAKKLKKGQFVIALGNPYAIARDGQASASWGIVSNLARKVGSAKMGDLSGKPTLHHFGTYVQTDARLNLGTSGGALINLQGEMVGLTTSLAALTGYEQAAGYAIPVDETFHRVVNLLKAGKQVEYGFLGVQPRNLTMHEKAQGMHGAFLLTVSSGTPALRAGLQQSDIVTHVNGEPIHDADGLRLQIARLSPLSQAVLLVERGSPLAFDQKPKRETLIRKVVVSKGPVMGKNIVTVRTPDWRGLRVDFTTVFSPPLMVNDQDGPAVAVDEVAEGSPAFKAGLRRGDLIGRVDDTAIETPEDFRREVANRQDPVELTVVVAGRPSRMVTIPPQ